MRVMHELRYRARLGLMKVYGPPRLDDEHDPEVALKREHAAEEEQESAEQEDQTA